MHTQVVLGVRRVQGGRGRRRTQRAGKTETFLGVVRVRVVEVQALPAASSVTLTYGRCLYVYVYVHRYVISAYALIIHTHTFMYTYACVYCRQTGDIAVRSNAAHEAEAAHKLIQIDSPDAVLQVNVTDQQ